MKILSLLTVAILGLSEGFRPVGLRRERLKLRAVTEHIDSVVVLQSWLSDASSVFSHAVSHGTYAQLTDGHTEHAIFGSLNLADADLVARQWQLATETFN